MWTLYSNPKTKNSIFDAENVDKIRELFTGYSYVQSLQVIKALPSLRTQITQQNLSYDIERLQCIFIESFCTAILAVFELSKLLSAKKLALNEVFIFKRNGKQVCCSKQRIINKTAQFRFQLLQKCNLKAVKKGSTAKKIRYMWFIEKNVGVRRFFGASSFINRVWQYLII